MKLTDIIRKGNEIQDGQSCFLLLKTILVTKVSLF
jgi:hypothetical protein